MNELKQFDYDTESFAPAKTGRGVRSILGQSRYIKPPVCKELPERLLKYAYAEDLAKDLIPKKNMKAFCLINGTFIAGDFIEAFAVIHNLHIKRLTISTLSLKQDNVDSLENLLTGNYVDELNLIVSDYFFSMERRGLVPYIYNALDKGEKFQLAAAGTHCKLTLIETHCGLKITMHGSANLRSSSNIEHICIEEGAELYDFNMEVQSAILEKYKTINKAVRFDSLWQTIK